MPYSMALWTILTKCPAPCGPQWSQPRSAVPAPAARPGVEVAHPVPPQPLCACEVVLEQRVAAIDDGVFSSQQGSERIDRRVHHTRGDHQPDVPRRLELLDQLGERRGARGPLACERGDGVARAVVDDAANSGAHEAAHHVRAHATETDHAEFHPASLALPCRPTLCGSRSTRYAVAHPGATSRHLNMTP